MKGILDTIKKTKGLSEFKGFTLIELLVVIAIIAILAAILFPVFAQAREKARQTTCLSNVKQIALCVQMYAEDYDETFPSNQWGDNSAFWVGQVLPYAGQKDANGKLFWCPSNGKFNKSDPLNSFSYGWNYINLSGTAWGSIVLTNLGQLEDPSNTIMYVDAILFQTDAWANSIVQDWHNGMSNIAWTDGHVKSMKKSAFMGDAHWNLWTIGKD